MLVFVRGGGGSVGKARELITEGDLRWGACHDIFLPIGSNVRIWFAELLLTVKAQTMLLMSTNHTSIVQLKDHSIWPQYCGKKKTNWQWFSMVCTLINNNIHSSQNVAESQGAADWLHNILINVMTNIVVSTVK